ncbi:hypothetical protein MKX01_009058 [Papaver californicum]|nr:hypothetical protein MKX01_009058 [Papaver californicum]
MFKKPLQCLIKHRNGSRNNKIISISISTMIMQTLRFMKSIGLLISNKHNVNRLTPELVDEICIQLVAHLLEHLKNSGAGIRAKAAEVVTTIVQNNPKSQQLVVEANSLEPLLANLTSDPDVTARTKALGAISCNFDSIHQTQSCCIQAANGYGALRDALSSDNVSIIKTWKALNLVQYLLPDWNVITELGFSRTMMHLVSSEDIEVRETALRGLLELAKDEQSRASSSSVASTDNEKLNKILEERIEGISAMTKEEKYFRSLPSQILHDHFEGTRTGN